MKVARSVNGNWTANVTKTVVLQAIATNPAPIDAVWTTGSESRVVAEAFSEAGRPAPLITGSITGDALGYWKANPDKYRFEGHAVLPGWTAQTLYRVAVRMLDGQKPTLNTLLSTTVSQVNNTVVKPLAGLLGIRVASADVRPDHIDCTQAQLVH